MLPLHVFIGTFDMPLPLLAVMVAAVAVVAISFGLIYLLPPRPERPEDEGVILPRPLVILLQTLAVLTVLYLLVVGLWGRQVAALNGAAILFWVIAIPVLPLIHCLVGGMYAVANPFALAARLITGGASARRPPDPRVQRWGYWPAVIQLFLLVWFELALRAVPSSPRALAALVAVYAVFQVAMGARWGEAWYSGGDLFQAITSLASTIAPVALDRDGKGFVRLKRGFRPGRFLPPRPGREALITLWLAGVLADGVRVTPIWRAVTSATQPFSDSIGRAGSFDVGDLLLDTAEILFTWLALGIFFWVFTWLAATLSRRDPRQLAAVVSPSLIPIALAYLLAHNLTQLVVLGPLIWTARDADLATAAGLIQQNVHQVTPAVIWWIQVTAIVAGHILAVIVAHARLARAEKDPSLAIRGDLGWLAAMLVYTATSLWVLAQPLTAG
jgi:hypothetical protein